MNLFIPRVYILHNSRGLYSTQFAEWEKINFLKSKKKRKGKKRREKEGKDIKGGKKVKTKEKIYKKPRSNERCSKKYL